MHLRLSLASAVVAVLAAPAAALAAPTLDPLNKCYVSANETQRERVGISAHGFPANAPVDVLVDEIFQAPDPAAPPISNALGDLTGSVSAPFVASGQRTFTLRVSSHADPTNWTVAGSAKVTALSVTQSPAKPATTSSRVRFRLRGFTDRTLPIYAHYVWPDGKSRQTVLMGKPYGDCGLLSVSRRQFPFRKPKPGHWWIQFDQEPAYNPAAPLYTKLKVDVTRRTVRPRH